MSVGEVCNREVIVIAPESSVLEAARLMRRYHVGDLVVVQQRNGKAVPLGIVTDRDLVIEVIAAEVDPSQVTVGDLTTHRLATAREGDEMLDSLAQMAQLGIRRLPVVDQEGALIGILTLDDLLDLLSEQVGNLARLVRTELRLEQERRSGE